MPAGMIPYEWGWISAALDRAIKTDTRSPDDVLAGLVSGNLVLWIVSGLDASGLVVTSIGPVRDTEVRGLWVLYVVGHVWGGPRQRLAVYREMLGYFEQMARDGHCDELWIEARPEWGRALGGFDVVERRDAAVSYRKALN